jgi:membrane protein insertase Oxa1/YidC/SpoIIIJ|tara:strand:+ start:128 stop:364 length:237 start_codon:yes stop_codon:yes gene_type:complete
MELDPTMIWNLVLTLIVAPFAWAFSKMFQEVKRLQILLNQTREEYAKRSDVQQEVKEIITHLQRLEDKIDRFIERNRS